MSNTGRIVNWVFCDWFNMLKVVSPSKEKSKRNPVSLSEDSWLEGYFPEITSLGNP